MRGISQSGVPLWRRPLAFSTKQRPFVRNHVAVPVGPRSSSTAYEHHSRSIRAVASAWYSSMAAPKAKKNYKKARKTHKVRYQYDDLLQKTERLIGEATSAKPSSTASADDCYETLEAWINIAEQSRNMEGARHAERLLVALEANVTSTISRRRSVLVPYASYYDVVLQSYAVSGGQKQAAEAAESVLFRMLALCQQYSEQSSREFVVRPCEPSGKAWNIAINCWAKSGDVDAGRRAEIIFNKMEQWKTYCDTHTHSDRRFAYRGSFPTERTLTGVIDAWSQSRHSEAPERASDLLHRVVESKRLQEPKYNQVRLDAAVFNSCIGAWSRSRRGRLGATKAEGILRMMTMINEMPGIKEKVLPNSRTYAMVLSAWAQCEKSEQTGDGARRAESILNQMISLYEGGSPVKPNVLAFTTCITAWARSHVQDAPERAELLLRRLIHLYKETGDADFKPDAYCGNAVVSAWARASQRPDSVEKAFMALQRMKSYCDVDIVGYSSLLDAMQKKGLADQALDLLETIESKAESDSRLTPNVFAYNTVLSALAKGGRSEEAEALLSRMEVLAARPDRSSVAPDKLSFTTAIDSWTRKDHPDALLRASRLLDTMLTRYRSGNAIVKPDRFTFSVFMKACLRPRQTKEQRHFALNKALEVFRIQEFGDPDHVSYSLLLRVISKQASDDQAATLLASVFEDCKRAGQVSQAVIESLQRTSIAPNTLDADWSRNVAKQEWPYTANFID